MNAPLRKLQADPGTMPGVVQIEKSRAQTGANSLRAAIEDLAAQAGNGRQLATALLVFQRDLVAAEAARLFGVTQAGVFAVDPAGPVDAPESSLCLRALKENTTVAEQTGTGVHIATPIGLAMPDRDGNAAFLVTLFLLPKATPLAIAMAQERLELSAAIARALISQKRANPVATKSKAASLFAESRLLSDGLSAAAHALQEVTQAETIVLGAVRSGRIIHIAHSAIAVLPSDLRQKYALALGEVIDFGGTISCGASADAPAPGGLAAAFGSVRLIGEAEITEAGDGVAAIALSPENAPAFADHVRQLALPVLARVRSGGVHPKIEQALAKIPALAKLPAEKRLSTASKWLLSAAAILFFVPVPDTVTGSVSIEPQTRRIVSAPVMSRLDKVHVQPGDTVIARKSVLVSLDSQALQAERDQAEATLQAAAADAATARSEGDPDRERASQLRAEQAQAQVALLDYRISETEIVAPVDGIVMGEDLRRKQGAQVNRGDSLFEIATPGAYRAEILVPDSDIEKVVRGKSVSVHLDAFTLKRLSGQVERIYPMTETVRGKNVFRVIAKLEKENADLQPGMGGEARIRSGWQILGWFMLEPVVDRARSWLWI